MQSIGERLEEARKRKGISIREAAEATKIRSDYLHKFESNQFDIKLPEIYVRGFLRTYANYLKLPPEKIVSDYNALGLNAAAAPKSLNREVYGRMDLSVSSSKPEKETKEQPAGIEPAEQSPPAGGTRNPATFVPRAGASVQLDRALLIKLGSMAGAAILVVGLLVWFLLREPSPQRDASDSTPAGTVWIRPNAGEKVLTLVAYDRVQVNAIQVNNGQVLFNGVLPKGDRRDIPWRAAMRINTETPENLRINVGGPTDYEMRDQKTGQLVKSAPIIDPAP